MLGGAIFDLPAYFRGEQPLWRAFWLFSVCSCGTLGFVLEALPGNVLSTDNKFTFVVTDGLTGLLGVAALVVVLRSHANTRYKILGALAFLALVLPAGYYIFRALFMWSF
jgi:hypothetical protein